MIRLLVLALLAWLGFTLGRRLLATPPAATQAPAPETMQRCAHCGVFIPVGESTQSRGYLFCSEAHRDAFFSQPHD